MRLIILLVLFVSTLFSHKLNIFLSEDNKNIVASAYFASGSFCKACKVEVFDENSNLLEEGETTQKGEYLIKSSLKRVVVRVEALGGHAAKGEFEVKEINRIDEKPKAINSIWQSLFAAFLIALIFLALKRVKK